VKIIAGIFLICASILTIHFAVGASSGDRPAGVDARNWIPVSDKMAFVVTTPNNYPGGGAGKQVLLLTPPAEGYFMVRTGNGWQRLVIVEPVKGPGATG
jgi:hypothetical protein